MLWGNSFQPYLQQSMKSRISKKDNILARRNEIFVFNSFQCEKYFALLNFKRLLADSFNQSKAMLSFLRARSSTTSAPIPYSFWRNTPVLFQKQLRLSTFVATLRSHKNKLSFSIVEETSSNFLLEKQKRFWNLSFGCARSELCSF